MDQKNFNVHCRLKFNAHLDANYLDDNSSTVPRCMSGTVNNSATIMIQKLAYKEYNMHGVHQVLMAVDMIEPYAMFCLSSRVRSGCTVSVDGTSS